MPPACVRLRTVGEPFVPLKGFPGVVWERPRKQKRPDRFAVL